MYGAAKCNWRSRREYGMGKSALGVEGLSWAANWYLDISTSTATQNAPLGVYYILST